MAIKVKATQVGFYGNMRRKVGAVFNIAKPEHFSSKWMKKLEEESESEEAEPADAEPKPKKHRKKHAQVETESHEEDSVI